ncbi:diacylglycerol kinase family lipid kinase [Polaribacter sp.]|nr:diacylglycerol kinase family protein [Polaribacter sp.]MDA9093255.1 diacylglycerol kinase family lipid kinase [Polaribacter sp.]MDB4010640.1 diacylglycerol kinase family lipid kinase [Polaribacter sp.]
MSKSWFIIANPIAGNQKFSKQWKEIQQLLNSKNIDYSFVFTQFSKHEIELVQNAIQQGFRNIISVGGDGTLHNIVNGVMMQRYVKSSDITIAVLPIGTGNDWIKTYNIPNNIKKAIDIISERKTILQDIGQIEIATGKISYFNNVAGLGYDGYIAKKLQELKRLGPISYLIAGIYGFLFYKKSIFKIAMNQTIIETTCLMTMVSICKFSGGGMQFSEKGDPIDGLFDITIVKNITLLDLILNIKKLYNGKIVAHPKIATYKTNKIIVDPQNSKPFIQADGELIGTGTATFSLIEKGIHFVIASD